MTTDSLPIHRDRILFQLQWSPTRRARTKTEIRVLQHRDPQYQDIHSHSTFIKVPSSGPMMPQPTHESTNGYLLGSIYLISRPTTSTAPREQLPRGDSDRFTAAVAIRARAALPACRGALDWNGVRLGPASARARATTATAASARALSTATTASTTASTTLASAPAPFPSFVALPRC